VADMNGDGRPDIVLAMSNISTIAWFENTPGAMPGEPPTFVQHDVPPGTGYASVWDVAVGDLDGVNGPDIVSINREGDFAATVHLNNGLNPPTFTSTNINDNAGQAHIRRPNSLDLADLDGDLDLDVVIGNRVEDSADDIVWFENLGGGSFASALLVAGERESVADLGHADFDLDGDVDLISAESGTFRAVWYENANDVQRVSDSALFPSLAAAIADMGTVSGDVLLVDSARFIVEPVVDLGGTGLTITSTSDIALREGSDYTLANGAELVAGPVGRVEIAGRIAIPPGAAATIDASQPMRGGSSRPITVLPSGRVDLAADAALGLVAGDAVSFQGQFELLAGSDLMVDAPELTLRSPFVAATGIIDMPGVPRTGLDLADLDGDGDLDLVAVSEFSPGEIFWVENGGGSDPTFVKHGVTQAPVFGRPREVTIADFNGDTHPDFMVSDADGQHMAWYQSDGLIPPTFAEIGLAVPEVRCLVSHDLDGDADSDVVVFESMRPGNGIGIRWLENDGMNPPSFSAHDVDPALSTASTAAFADLNGDGNVDIISGTRSNIPG
ncbi:MAG: VCBS repeat-containing protein, partial [Phycisphaerales bacterium]|nr:VCBS repeat-containing protein [Phycisphaerales bacterium]